MMAFKKSLEADYGFNRTFMELKCSTQIISLGRRSVLIVPLWN